MVRIADPNNQICPECGEQYSSVFDCIVNQFYHDIVFVHVANVRMPFDPRIVIAVPRFCGRYVDKDVKIEVDLPNHLVRITE